MKIVTDGIYFRIQEDGGKFIEDYHSGPDGMNCTSTFQTRFYGKALRRFGREFKNQIRNKQQTQWTAVS